MCALLGFLLVVVPEVEEEGLIKREGDAFSAAELPSLYFPELFLWEESAGEKGTYVAYDMCWK